MSAVRSCATCVPLLMVTDPPVVGAPWIFSERVPSPPLWQAALSAEASGSPAPSGLPPLPLLLPQPVKGNRPNAATTSSHTP